MPTQVRAKHKFCRRIGYCLWGSPKCPSVKRPYPAGSHGKSGRKKKLSTYGELLMEKQKLQVYYGLSEMQIRLAFQKSKKGKGMTNEKLFHNLEFRLDATVYRSGLAPSIFAARQYVTHCHVYVDGKKVNRPSYHLKPGQVVSLNAEKSPSIAEAAKNSNSVIPGYLEVDREHLKATVLREPAIEEMPVQIEMMKVVEFYAR